MTQALADGGCDLIALEMMQDAVRAFVAMQSARELGLPVWLGPTCTREEKESGNLVAFDLPENRFADILAATLPIGPDLVCVMHSDVDVIEPDAPVARARTWADHGVTVFGGCCGFRPDHVAALDRARGSFEAIRSRHRT